MENENKIWLITGVSTGFGKHLAEEAGKKGYTVFGTVRKAEQLEMVNNLVPGKTFGRVLDVNDHAQVASVVHSILQAHSRIDVLVNNAGYGLFGGIEEVTMEEAREQMETNFFGALAVTQAVLPTMRKQKSGHIIQISSIAGLSASAGLGIYNASKHALEGFSEALSLEVASLGIKVTLVEPGPFRTHWAGASMKFAKNHIGAYDPSVGKVKAMLEERNGNQPGDPLKGAQAIIHITEVPKAPLRLALGKMAVVVINKKIESLSNELNAWKQTSEDTDY